jgi:hypothetical protein
MKLTFFVKRTTTTKMESLKIKGGRFVMKCMEIEKHENTWIDNG